MISREESGLSVADYAAQLSDPTPVAWQVIAARTNLNFEALTTDTTVTGNSDSDFTVVSANGFVYRLVDLVLERLDPATDSWTVLKTFTAPGTPYVHTPALWVDGATIHVWLLQLEGLYQSVSTDGGATFGAFSLIYAGDPSYYSYSDDLAVYDESRILASSERDVYYRDHYAFDGTSNFWAANGATGSLRYQFPVGRKITKYTVQARGSAEWVAQAPKSWTLQSSPDGTTWTTIHTVTNAPAFTQGEKRTYIVTPLASGIPAITAQPYWRLNVTANQGDAVLSIGEVELMDTYSNPQPGVIHVTAVASTRLHVVVRDSATSLNHLRVLTESGGSWTATDSDVWWSFEIDDFQAVALADDDLLVAVSEVPGTMTIFTEDGSPVKYLFTSGGLIAWRYRNGSWSDHTEIDLIDDERPWRTRSNARLWANDGTAYVSCYGSDGSEAYPIAGYRLYASKDGRYWTGGEFLPMPDTSGSCGLALALVDETLYGLERAAVYTSPATLAVGVDAAAMQLDLTPYISDYALDHSGALQTSLQLDNPTGLFDAHAILNRANTVRLTHKFGRWVQQPATASGTVVIGADPVVIGADAVVADYSYYPAADAPQTYAKALLTVGQTQVDTLEVDEQLPETRLRLTGRDLLSWMTDQTQSDQAYYWQSQITAGDDYVDSGDSTYGGLAHTAVQSGTFKTNAQLLEIDVASTESIAFSTLLSNLWNGSASVGFTLVTGGSAQYAGVVFRAIDTANLFYAVYEQAADKIRLYQRLGGQSSQLAESAALSWSGDLTITRYLRVDFRYGAINVYHSTDSAALAYDGGKSWTLAFSHSLDVSGRLYGVPGLKRITATLPERGAVGVIAAGSRGLRMRAFQTNDRNGPSTVEDAFRALGSFSGLLDFDFDALTDGVTGFSYDATGVTGTSSDGALTLAAPSSPAATWFKAVYTDLDLPHNYLLRFDVNAASWAAVVSLLDDGSHYLVGQLSNVPFIKKWNGASYDTLLALGSLTTPTAASVEVVFREIRFGDTSQEIYRTLALWLNHQLILSTAELVDAPISGAVRAGFAAYTGSSVSYTNIAIPELTTFADWVALDPGETPMTALQRAIEGYYLKFYLRHDNRLRAWKPKAAPSVYTYPASAFEQTRLAFDARELKTRVRQVGAYTEAEVKRNDLIRRYGDRFAKLSNPYLMTEAECYEQALASIRRLEEAALVEQYQTVYQPLLEHEDHITTPSGERLLTSRSIAISETDALEQGTGRNYAFTE